MKKLLFVDCCIRDNSRTKKLASYYLNTKKDYDIKGVKLTSLNIKPLDENAIIQRDVDIKNNNFSKYEQAIDFANVDEIVIAAPYWDMSFPSLLKVYFENICVNGITFEYDENGKLVKKVKAKTLTYIVTSGGPLSNKSSLYSYLKELCDLFSIPTFNFYYVDMLDVYPNDVCDRLIETAKKF